MNQGLERMYRRWGIQSVSTGGWQPQATPVERFHKFFNQTMMGIKKGYDGGWSEFCSIITWVYNSSACLSTGGYTPHQLCMGTDPTLLQDLNILEEHMDEAHASCEDYFLRTAKRMTDIYKIVRRKQAEMAERNRLRREATSKEVSFSVGDLVLLWEPRNTVKLHKDGTEVQVSRKMPSKWQPKWTGPHKITAVESSGPRGDRRYTIEHLKGRHEKALHPNRLQLFDPWSKQHLSTSPEPVQAGAEYLTGTHAPDDALFLVALDPPWPFGIGKVVSTGKYNRIKCWWYGNDDSNNVNKPYKKGWRDGRGKTYYADEPAKPTHKPFYETRFIIKQSDLLCHSFALGPEGKIPASVIKAAKDSEDVWWPDARIEDPDSLDKAKQ